MLRWKLIHLSKKAPGGKAFDPVNKIWVISTGDDFCILVQ